MLFRRLSLMRLVLLFGERLAEPVREGLEHRSNGKALSRSIRHKVMPLLTNG